MTTADTVLSRPRVLATGGLTAVRRHPLIVVLVALVAAFQLSTGSFLTPANLSGIATDAATLAIVAVPLALLVTWFTGGRLPVGGGDVQVQAGTVVHRRVQRAVARQQGGFGHDEPVVDDDDLLQGGRPVEDRSVLTVSGHETVGPRGRGPVS
ncbi:hypothetical protein [Streptomyces sp. NBC_00453]|uniref:hypothetical protein n=1 Tax=Streptomyces sp. NBC_00453 TaxID=2903653 RepID=UPI002E1D086B